MDGLDVSIISNGWIDGYHGGWIDGYGFDESYFHPYLEERFKSRDWSERFY